MSVPKDTERDPHIDALLTSALSAADGVEAEGCPDVEVIGLYAERALVGAELRAVDAHVHMCGRCQATVAALVRALPDEAAGVLGAGATGASADGGFAAWFAGWRWLVPAASLTAVALVAVWVGRGPADDLAKASRADGIAAGAGNPPPAAESSLARQIDQFARRDGVSGDVATREVPRPRTSVPADTRTTAGPERRAKVSTEPQAAERTAAANTAIQTTALADAREAAAAAAPLQEALSVTSAPSVAAPAAPVPAPPTTARALQGAPVRSGRVLGANDSSVIPVAGAGVFRLRAGSIERSGDQGRTWQRATLPTGVTVLAIASPAPGICWAIAADAVLRATDGTTFTHEPVPSAERLTGITASDAMNAVVTTVSRARFATTNGGRTWAPAP